MTSTGEEDEGAKIQLTLQMGSPWSALLSWSPTVGQSRQETLESEYLENTLPMLIEDFLGSEPDTFLSLIADCCLLYRTDGYVHDSYVPSRCPLFSRELASIRHRGGRIEQVVPDDIARQFLMFAERSVAVRDVLEYELNCGAHEQEFHFQIRVVSVGSDAVLALIRDLGLLGKAYADLQRAHDEMEYRVEERTRQLSEAMRALREAQAHVVHEQKMSILGHFVAGLTHEMNTPMAALDSVADTIVRASSRLTEALAPGTEMDRAKTEAILSILRSSAESVHQPASRLTAIVKQLKRFARLDEAEQQNVDIHDCVDSALELLREGITAKLLSIEREYSTLPLLKCNPRDMNQMFYNIIQNSIEASSMNGRILITTKREVAAAVVVVRDFGVGIPERNFARVFDPGFTTKGVGVGLGLGLPIARRIVTEHRGTIELVSKKSEGTSAVVRIPLDSQ